ncbi:MAG TPA: transposase [Candidatus Saccharimonadia bacterium]|nr:transposase [Candidatus Saccharimonadia bacterium]
MPDIHPKAAGMDIGARAIVVAVPPERAPEPVRVFETCTPDLHALVDGLLQCGIDTVVMASTGVYWVPVFALLEQRGIQPSLVNARHVKTVPGRKSDGNDAQWLQKLHALGLWQGSLRPDAERGMFRTLLRHRATLMAHRAPPILPMQKALKRMNLQVSAVLTDIPGVTGHAILRAIVHGERDPLRLAQWRTAACKSSADVMAKARTGTWRDEPVFMLTQALEFFDFSARQSAACDVQIARQCAAMKPRCTSDEPAMPLPRVKPGAQSKHQPSDNARTSLLRLTGVDLVAVTGLSASIAQTILAEVGTDRGKCPTVKHCCSWRGLAPHNDISGGRV